MKFSYKSTMDAVRVIHPEFLGLMEAGHIRMDLPSLLDRAAREYFMKFCGAKTPSPTDEEVQASINIHEALLDLQTKSHLDFGVEHFRTAVVPIRRQRRT